ncbi:antibiotic biosynthesis monooxygenase family protein [Azospirillum brasilense]|uniref:antibiotic biosynthesis monooxygenase family protein n=1 Tax=Azospirillum brasilense TaxID=192 RepID=UPI00298E9151|nr:antibiotic biosynthesis monooxygenase [Azospirillum brasilense]MDW7631863.1 antibiotic biosynthesis monooxygenase [Azospirillum brasilense]
MSATVQVIDLIETESLDDAEAMWRAVCGFLATQPGFLSGELLNTFQSIHPKGDYKFTSCCQWESDAAWQAARQAARENPELALGGGGGRGGGGPPPAAPPAGGAAGRRANPGAGLAAAQPQGGLHRLQGGTR